MSATEESTAKPEVPDEEDDGVIGPLPSLAAEEHPPAKKRKVLKFEKVFLGNLPSSELFEKSYMHRDTISHIVVTKSEFIITASVDGHVKFWKKLAAGIEFVKLFRAHVGNIQEIAANWDGSLLCTISTDKSLKVFDVINYDLINILRFDYVPGHCDWIYTKGDAMRVVAVAASETPHIYIYDGLETATPIRVLDKLHAEPVTCIKYCPSTNCVLSIDKASFIEIWTGASTDYKEPDILEFTSKLDTDLFKLMKDKAIATNIAFDREGNRFAVAASDRKIRVFNFRTGRLWKVFDEGLKTASDAQNENPLMSNMEFGRRMAMEKDLERTDMLRLSNIVFDESGNFLLYPTLVGVKVVNLVSNKCVRILGKSESLRPLAIALYQGIPGGKQSAVTAEKKAAENPALQDVSSDPTLVCSAFRKHRFYIFSNRTPGEDEEREVFNEKPSKEDIVAATETSSKSNLASNAVIHTSVGDVHVKLFPRECPKAVENFVVHSRNGYYNGHIFHRVIKGFMIQTGDPTGVGSGGESIWGGEFADEFHPDLKHDKPYTLSMANAGPNTNGSQFFVTVVPCPWLDNKHTVFGRITKGMEVAQNISLVKTHPKTDKPYDDVTIVSITIK